MFMILLLLTLAAAVIHGLKTGPRTAERFSELMLVYLLVVYHGFIMLAVGLYILLAGEQAAAMLSAPSGNVFQEFFAFAYIGMAICAIPAIWWRGTYLIAPVLVWSIYFFGATYIHITEYWEAGQLTFNLLAWILMTHAGPPLLMLALVIWPYIATRRLKPTVPSPGTAAAPRSLRSG